MNEKEKKKMKIDFSIMLAETSYYDKTFIEAEKAIEKWKKYIRELKLNSHDFSLLNYILNSRLKNIKILKSHFSHHPK